MKHPKNWLNTVVFGGFTLSLTAGLLFMPGRDYSENEKRYLAQAPRVSLSAFLDGSLQTGMEDWSADQFPFRDGFVGLNAYWTLASGRNAVQDIYYCKNGYLVNAPRQDTNGNFESNLTRLNDFAADCGIPAEMVLVPSSGYLLGSQAYYRGEDLLPAGHLPYEDDTLFEQAEAALTNVTFYDFRGDLQGTDAQICYHTDHHLNAYGNETLYWSYLAAHGMTPAEHTFTSHDGFYGTTWSGSGYWGVAPDTVKTWDGPENVTVTITDSGEEPVVSNSVFFTEHLEEMDKYPVYLDGNHSLVQIENPDAPEGTLLLLKDSYAHCFTAFLAEHYRTIYMIDLRYYRDSVSGFIQENGVDTLLYFYGVDTLLTDTNSAWLR